MTLFAGSVHATPAAGSADSGGDTLEQFAQKCKAVDALKERAADVQGADGFKAGFDFGQCVAYISGVLEFHAVLRGIDPEMALFCVPARGVTINEVVKLVVKYADEHPEDRKKSISGTLLGLLMQEFPCQAEPSKKPDSERSTTRL
jgi:hypothetical protein